MVELAHHQIGEVAERVGLSLRTIRYWEEIGLVTPSGRTEGGFRLYTEEDIERLELVKALKPVGMSLETMHELLTLRDRVGDASAEEADQIGGRFQSLMELARQRCDELEAKLRAARAALRTLERGFGKGGVGE